MQFVSGLTDYRVKYKKTLYNNIDPGTLRFKCVRHFVLFKKKIKKYLIP